MKRSALTLVLLLSMGCQSAYDDRPLTKAEAQEIHDISSSEMQRLNIEMIDAKDAGDDSVYARLEKQLAAESQRFKRATIRLKEFDQ